MNKIDKVLTLYTYRNLNQLQVDLTVTSKSVMLSKTFWVAISAGKSYTLDSYRGHCTLRHGYIISPNWNFEFGLQSEPYFVKIGPNWIKIVIDDENLHKLSYFETNWMRGIVILLLKTKFFQCML